VAAKRFIGPAPHPETLAVGDGVLRAVRSRDPLGAAIAGEEHRENLWLHRALPERAELLPSGHREQVGTSAEHRVDGARHQIGRVDRVRVGEAQDLAARSARAGLACPRLAEPAFGKIRRADDT
jgi:hypothetical protein